MSTGILIIENINEKDEFLLPLINEFNKLAEDGHYPELLNWNHYQLFTHTVNTTPQDWKLFLQHPKVKQWYDDELEIQMRTAAAKLVKEIQSGNARSTGLPQALSSVLGYLDKREKVESTTRIIYNFIPLTEYEQQNPEIKVLDFIPTEIKQSIQIIGLNSDRKKG